MLKFSDWINRIRHNRGFGVQSPTAFFFVTQVLKEKLPYYAYNDIDRIARTCGTHSKSYCRRLFRITNYMRPKSIIATGAQAAAPLCAIAAAACNAQITYISKGDIPHAAEQYLAQRGCNIPQGDSSQQLAQALQAQKEPLLLFIGSTSDLASTLRTALRQPHKQTVIIIDGIHKSPERLQQWDEAVKSSQTVVTYDLYSLGILLFDNEKQKQHYTLKM